MASLARVCGGVLRSGAPVAWPSQGQNRSYATLKEVQNRIKSVKNIRKITKSMKMVAASKLRHIEAALMQSRPMYQGLQTFYEAVEIPEKSDKQLIVAIASDRGLCGSVNNSLVKKGRLMMASLEKEQVPSLELLSVGDKARTGLGRTCSKYMSTSYTDVGKKKPPSFSEAMVIATEVVDKEFDLLTVLFNRYKSAVAFENDTRKILSFENFKDVASAEVEKFEFDGDRDVILRDLHEFYIATTIHNCLLENSCSEMSQRMAAMENASKNAGEMIDKLTLLFNRSRQAAITTSLVEIISGASAVEQ